VQVSFMNIYCRNMLSAVDCSLNRYRGFSFKINMVFCAQFMGVVSYYFSSNFECRLCLATEHARCHCIADPAAQGQQGNQESKEQVAHENL